jgi:hypothetical protein
VRNRREVRKETKGRERDG